MELNNFTIFNFNASRCSNLLRIRQFYEFFDPYDTMFVCIQEIKVSSAIKVFSDKYQVFINLEQGSLRLQEAKIIDFHSENVHF